MDMSGENVFFFSGKVAFVNFFASVTGYMWLFTSILVPPLSPIAASLCTQMISWNAQNSNSNCKRSLVLSSV